MGMYDLTDDGEPQSGPVLFVRDKGVEERGEVGRVDAAAVISDLYEQKAFFSF